jgi:cyclase
MLSKTMFSRRLLACGLCATALLADVAGAASPTGAYSRSEPGADSDTTVLAASLVKTGLYMFSGSSNSLLRLSANGLIVVDGQSSGNYDALRKQIERISDQPIRLLVNTDHYPEHTANNARFIAAGTQVLAQENVAKNLGKLGSAGEGIAPPTKTYDRDFTVSMGGIEARVMHLGNARTDGDSVVYFPNLRVVAVGDLFAATPSPDFPSGGSLVGWGPVLGEILKLDFDVVVPGSGPTVRRADLAAFKARIDTLVSRAADLVSKGVPKARLMAQLQTEDLGWKLAFTDAQVDSFYRELSEMNRSSASW